MPKRPTRYASSKQENLIANYLGLKVTKNSGAATFDKGDMKGGCILGEAKTMMEPQLSHSIKKEWFNKLRQEAIAKDKDLEVLFFDFGTQQLSDQYAAMPITVFRKLYSAYLELNAE